MELEILAPCGSRESLIAAVRCGANAVYLGTKAMNARRNAENFDTEALREAVRYCHERNVKVYVTVNTLVADSEMKTAYDTVAAALHCGADGFIVQDLGLAKMIRECFPSARLHASTQCSVSTPDGFRALEALGFSRAVLPREMSLDEIKEIRESTDMELEIFVHGALCMCVSGQCYLSAMLGGRSGNRGLCAQPCRLSFSADSSGSCDLSLKDLSLIAKLKEIQAAGVISLKIEGRMKRPEYVAAAVTACKNAIEGHYDAEEEAVLQRVFSRSGFTDGYFTGKRQEMFGTRRKEDVVAAEEVLKDLARLYHKEQPLVGVALSFVCKENQPLTLTAKTDRKEVTVTSVLPAQAVHRPLTEEAVRERLAKLGGTPYYPKEINITLDGGLIVSAAQLNALRREAIQKLGEQEETHPAQHPLHVIDAKEKNAKPYYTARFLRAEQVPPQHPFTRIFLPIGTSDDDFLRTGAGVELPRGLFGQEERLKRELTHLKAIGVTNALCANAGAYATAQQLGFRCFGDYGLNLFNSESANLFASPILSFELTLEQANRINAPDTGIIAYGHLPLMLTRNCPVKHRIGCERCQKHGALTDRKGYKFPVKCSSYPCTEILNPLPLCLSDRMDEIKTDFIHFYFTDETQEEVLHIVKLYKNHTKPDGQYTRGLYYRGVK